MNFSDVQKHSIPQGNVTKITQGGIVLWQRLSKIEYVRSYGLEYIDTGIVPDSDTKVVLDFAMEDMSQYSTLIGASNTAGTKQYCFACDGLEYVYSYGGQNLNTWKPSKYYDRHIVEIDGADATFEGDTKSYEAEDFVVPETLKIFGKGVNAPIKYYWYKDGAVIDGWNTEDLKFSGITEEAGTFYVTAHNDEDPTKYSVSGKCDVVVNDKSLLSGVKYTHNATENNWYFNNNPTGRPNVFDYNCEFLTDGNIYNDYWEDKYFGVKNFDPVIEFNLDDTLYFRELQIYAHAEDNPANAAAGVYAPNVTISIGNETTVFEGKMVDSSLVLVSDQPISTDYLNFAFVRNGAYCFIDEIRAFAEPTGLTADGFLEPKQEPNIIRGKYPNTTISSLPKGMASGSTTDYGILTNGNISDNSVSYKKNITFYDDVASFGYYINEMVAGIRVYSHTPINLNNSGIDTVTIQTIEDNQTVVLATGTVDEQGLYEWVPNTDTYLRNVIITMTRRKGVPGADWSGISLSEIQVLRPSSNYYAEPSTYNLKRPTTEPSDTDEPSVMYAVQRPAATATGLTPQFVLNLDKKKTVNVLDKFTLTAVAVADNNTVIERAQCRIYSCQIYKKGVLVRDFEPAVNANGEAGLYDKVESIFYELKQ